MSEQVAKRSAGEPRQTIDLGQIERRMRDSIEPQFESQAHAPDPLTELARLVGGETDPFRQMFAERPSLNAPPPVPQMPQMPRVAHLRPIDGLQSAPQNYGVERDEPYARPAYPGDESWQVSQGHEQAHAPQSGDQTHVSHDYDHADAGSAHNGGNAPQNYGYLAAQPPYGNGNGQDGRGHDQQWSNQDLQTPNYDDYPDEPPRRSGRAKLLIGAALLVVAGGIGATYAMRSSGGVGGEAPTIMAAGGAVKVQPAQTPSADGPKQTISLLERGARSNTDSKVVQSGEQPMDLAQASRGQAGNRPARTGEAGAPVTLAPPAPPPVANSLFAEPKRVKSVAVRPDGSIIEPAGATPAPAAGGRPNDIASLVAASMPSTTPGSGSAASKATIRAPEAKPAVAPAPKPVAAVAPSPAAAAPAAGGAAGFAVQMAGTSSESEARDAAERLTRKFASELGGRRLSVVKADVGSKTVYRVRATGLTSDDANTLCARLKSGGGTCFVAR